MIGPEWAKSTFSEGGNSNCLEACGREGGHGGLSVNVRDTQNRRLGHVDITPRAWADALTAIKAVDAAVLTS